VIVERVKAGPRNARAKGKRLGRPRKILDTKRIVFLRAQGVGWKRIATQMSVGVGTLYRVAVEGSKTQQRVSLTRATMVDVKTDPLGSPAFVSAASYSVCGPIRTHIAKNSHGHPSP
jgi:hypothetical protein